MCRSPEQEHRLDLGALARVTTAVARSIVYHRKKDAEAAASGAGGSAAAGAGEGAGAGPASAVVDEPVKPLLPMDKTEPVLPVPPMTVEDGDESDDGGDGTAEAKGDDSDELMGDVVDNTGTPAMRVQPRLEKLLRRATYEISSEPKLWSIAAYYNAAIGEREQQVKCLQRQCRAYQSGAWYRDEKSVGRLCDASCDLLDAYLHMVRAVRRVRCWCCVRAEGVVGGTGEACDVRTLIRDEIVQPLPLSQNTKQTLSRGRMHAKGILARAVDTFPDHPQVARLQAMVERIETARKELAAAASIAE